MASTPDTTTTRNVINPFKEIAQPAVDQRKDRLTTQRDELDSANNGLVSEISDMLSTRLDAAYTDDNQSLEAQIASAESLNDDLEAIKAKLNGTSTVASAPALTTIQQQAADDVASGRLFQHRSGAWGDKEWSDRRPAPTTPDPASDESSGDNSSSEPTSSADTAEDLATKLEATAKTVRENATASSKGNEGAAPAKKTAARPAPLRTAPPTATDTRTAAPAPEPTAHEAAEEARRQATARNDDGDNTGDRPSRAPIKASDVARRGFNWLREKPADTPILPVRKH